MPAPERVTVVIGAGVIGAAAALALRRSGRAVALLDAERVAAGASGWSGGVARVFHLDPEEARRAAYGFPVLRDLRRAIGIGAPFHETGYLYFPRPQDREAALAAARALASDHGTEFVGSGQLATLYPGLGRSASGGGARRRSAKARSTPAARSRIESSPDGCDPRMLATRPAAILAARWRRSPGVASRGSPRNHGALARAAPPARMPANLQRQRSALDPAARTA